MTFHRCFLLSFGSFGQAVSEEKIKKNQPIRNKNCLWRPCLSMDRDEISNLYRGPSIDASYQVSEEKIKMWKVNGRQTTDDGRRKWWQKLTQPIRNKNCLWRPCLLMDQDKLSNLYREPLIDDTYQVSLYLAKRFQRRRFFLEINQSEHELSVAAMFVNGSGRNEQTL